MYRIRQNEPLGGVWGGCYVTHQLYMQLMDADSAVLDADKLVCGRNSFPLPSGRSRTILSHSMYSVRTVHSENKNRERCQAWKSSGFCRNSGLRNQKVGSWIQKSGFGLRPQTSGFGRCSGFQIRPRFHACDIHFLAYVLGDSWQYDVSYRAFELRRGRERYVDDNDSGGGRLRLPLARHHRSHRVRTVPKNQTEQRNRETVANANGHFGKSRGQGVQRR